jgi:hypothetical protein
MPVHVRPGEGNGPARAFIEIAPVVLIILLVGFPAPRTIRAGCELDLPPTPASRGSRATFREHKAHFDRSREQTMVDQLH